MKKVSLAAATVVAAIWCVSGAAEGAVLCKKRNGAVVVRDEACKKKETALDATAFIAAGAIGTGLLQDGGVEGSDLADASVSAAKLAPGTVPKAFSLNPYGAILGGIATLSSGYGQFAGIHLPDGANGSLGLGFVVPPNYTAGTPLTVRVLWHTDSTGCQFSLRANSISVARNGRQHLYGGGSSDGLMVVGGETVAAPASSNQTTTTLLEITSPESGSALEPGDSVIFNIFRSGGFGPDTCTGDMVIQAFQVEYQ